MNVVPRSLFACLSLLLFVAGTPAAELQWERVQLDDRFRSEGVAAADINQDGLPDVVAGDVWYAAPDWAVHEIRPPGDFVAGAGYSRSFQNWTYDINADGLPDVIIVSFPGEAFHWYENPGEAGGHWPEHEIWHSINNESPLFGDITGDGKPEVVFGSQPESQMGYVEIPAPENAEEKWEFVPISRPGDPHQNGTFRFYHGLGLADVNADESVDVVIPHGWWENPGEAGQGEWEFHEHKLAAEPNGNPLRGADIYAEDLDGDGDRDLLMSSAHAFGVWWFEGQDDGRFAYHLVDDSYSQTHAAHFVDLDGDGDREFVTGKRFYAHNSKDPGGKDPVVMYYYEIKRGSGSPPEFIAHEIEAGRDTGVGTQFAIADMNEDGRLDIVLSNKKGVNVLLQKKLRERGVNSQEAFHKVIQQGIDQCDEF